MSKKKYSTPKCTKIGNLTTKTLGAKGKDVDGFGGNNKGKS